MFGKKREKRVASTGETAEIWGGRELAAREAPGRAAEGEKATGERPMIQ